MMNEVQVKLNKNELTALIFALNYMSKPNEVYLQQNYTDVNRLYNKLFSFYEKMNTFAGNYQGPLYSPHPDLKK